MKRVLSLIPLSVLLLCSAGCDKDSFDAKSTEQLHRENGVPVKTLTINPEPLEFGITYNSVLTGWKESVASAMVSDRVSEIHYKVGDFVKKDDVVISFPTDNPSAQFNQSKAAYNLAKTTLKRMRNLYESGGISQQAFDEVQTQFNVAEANFDAVKQSINVKAPISGTISQISIRVTDNVAPGDNLFTVSNSDRLKTQVWVTDENIAFVKKGNTAIARWGNIELQGKITQVDLSYNRDHQAFGVIAEFENTASVPSGISAEIEFKYSETDPSIFIERKDLVKEKDTHYIYVAEGKHAIKREVKLGRSFNTQLEILDGINSGDQLITEGLQLLDDGTLIMVLDQ